jgi:hypothetical protein
MSYAELLIGCGRSRQKQIVPKGSPAAFTCLTTLDCNPDVNPDVCHDLDRYPWPLIADSFDEVHAYEVLEHLGRQGDARAFFNCFSELWRVLKPGGVLAGSCPSLSSRWLWGDPGHTRVIAPESLVYLSQSHYIQQCDTAESRTPMTDYRDIYRADFEPIGQADNGETFRFVLKAIKPSRFKQRG